MKFAVRLSRGFGGPSIWRHSAQPEDHVGSDIDGETGRLQV